MKILLITDDANVEAEITAALSTSRHAPLLTCVRERRKGIESARNLEPDLVLIALTDDLAQLRETRVELTAASPKSAVAAIYDPQALGATAQHGTLLVEAFRLGVCDVLRRPVSSADGEQLLARIAVPTSSPTAALGQVASFISNKGGVGKSTLSINTACGLAQKHPGEVLLIDAALQLGVCASMLDLRPQTTLTDALRERERLDATLLRQLVTPHSSGLHLLAAPASVVDAADIDDEAITRIINIARRSYRYVVIDTFPLLDRVVVAILDLTDQVFLVVENVVPTLIGARSLVGLLNEIGVPRDRLRLVLNRYTTFGGSLKPHEVASELGVPVAHVIPFHAQAIVAANTGVPYILRRHWFGPGRATWRLVNELEKAPLQRLAPLSKGRV